MTGAGRGPGGCRRGLALVLLAVQGLAGAGLGQDGDPAALSLEAKAGRLFMAFSLSSARGEARERLLQQVRDGLCGGVVLSLGTTGEARELIRDLQLAAPLPLLIAGDFETGLSFRLRDAPHLGNAMLLGATGSRDLAHRIGLATAAHGAALGFHLAFAPVLDVNNNPDNPIINVRSLGADPELVADLGCALVRGIQSGMIATVKHFPGHGDVAADSHLVLPEVRASIDRLQRLELLPFRRAIEAGAGAVMTAHLQVPALDPAPNTPATVSPAVMTGLLRKELGFGGLLVTDALEMGGIRKVMPAEEAAVRALQAGSDILLMPPDPRKARDAVVQAVRSGRVQASRLDEAVGRIFAARRRFAATPAPLSEAVLAEHRALGAEVARRGVTLVRDRQGLVPLPAGGELCVLDLLDSEQGAERGTTFAEHLRRRGIPVTRAVLHPRSSAAEVKAAFDTARSASRLLVGMHVRVRAFQGSIGLPANLRGIRDLLVGHPRALAVSYGNPYLARDFAGLSGYLCAFDQGPVIEAAVADAVTGAAPVTGRLPVSIPGVAELGDGESRYSGLADGDPRQQGMPADLADRIAALLRAEIAKGTFPGAVAMVVRRGQVVARVAAGRETYAADAPPVTVDTRYDLASLTKVCATLPAVAVLLHQGRIALDDKLVRWVPEFRGEGKDAVTLRHVMVHSSGLPAYIRFFLQGLKGKANYVAACARTELTYPPGEKRVYSDLGLMLLMAVVEKASGKTLDRFLAEDVYPRLGIEACFTGSGSPIAAAPTEVDDWRGRLVRGEVHDENAFAMGGVSGHAGLFGTAEDVARIGVLFLGGGGGLIPPPLARKLTTRDDLVPGSTRALLWDTFQKGGSGGSLLSPWSFGHTGFTGTCIWCDPRTDLCMVLLTNRVHPTRDNRKISAARRAFHDLVASQL